MSDNLKDLGTRTLKTERLILRKFTKEDIEEMHNNWATDEEMHKYVNWRPRRNIEETTNLIENWISEYKQGSYNWIVELKDTHELIGNIAIREINKKHNNCTVGYNYSSKYWNQGYGTEALRRVIEYLLNDCEFYLVASAHNSNNPSSGRIMQKVGMKQDAILRKRRYDPNTNTYNDLVWYSITKDELYQTE